MGGYRRLSVGASGDKLCGKMREKDLGSKETAMTTAIQEEVSMRIHGTGGGRGREEDKESRRESGSFNEFRAGREKGEKRM